MIAIDAVLSEILKESAANPDDVALRLIAADCAEDAGRPYWAEALRWMAAGKRRPRKWTDHDGIDRWTWDYNLLDHLPGKEPGKEQVGTLPRGVLCDRFRLSFTGYGDSPEESEMFLMTDWETERLKGWQPPREEENL